MALSMAGLSYRPAPPALRFDPLRHPAVAAARFLPFREFALSTENAINSCPRAGLRMAKFNRSRSIVSMAAFSHEESNFVTKQQSDIEVEKTKSELDHQAEESQEAWKQTVEAFKDQAMKMQAVSQAAYEAYSKRAMVILKKSTEQLKIQADKARHDLAVLAKEFGEEGKEYLSTVAQNSPEPVKEVVDTFSSSTDKFTHFSEVRDFYLGIPYGLLLSVGGFLSFMLTGSISAIRFGLILGGSLLVLSISSLRSWKRGESSTPFLQGQAAIAVILFLRELRFLSQSASLPTSLMTLMSGTMVLFYMYRIWLDDEKWESSLDRPAEN